jgi:UDP-N-acetylglucosamine 2-epimerase (non-hydrolysing)
VKLIGTAEETVYRETAALLSDHNQYRAMSEATNPYGDGQASFRIVQTLLWRKGMVSQPPLPFIACKK